ncbi:MAG: ribose 5-phosphate isomerase B [Azospirillaceae bacterium]|nr:ribose 5-phosphate isomerase B [Azospirillaceae bacterium]
MTGETIAIAADHAGFALKAELKAALEQKGFMVLDLGTHGPASVDYPDFGTAMGEAIRSGQVARGVLVCATGIGISIAANRFPEVRCALCHDVTTARFARLHNNANVLALGARIVGTAVAQDCLETFLATPFEGGRHALRVAKLG